MSIRNVHQRALAVAISMLMAAMALFVPAWVGTAAPAHAASSPCPGSGALGDFVSASNVGVATSGSGTTRTYWFVSLMNESSINGVPGLVNYCVYPSPSTPASVNATATGANGKAWTGSIGSTSFAFSRPNGNPSNIPLDGQTTEMGTATFSSPPSSQTILLHINDHNVCASLYPDNPDTCFVKPLTAPICNAGETDVAYNNLSFGAVNCFTAAEGFECCGVRELGDGVTLKAEAGRNLVSLQVLFASFACTSGHWNTGDCVTEPAGATFTHPITATIYAVDNSSGTPAPGALLAQVTTTQTIPYRPSADPVNCTGSNAGKWFNPAGNKCQNSIGTVLTFTFGAGITLPNQVIWTVAFNTTNAGYNPLGTKPCSTNPGGCPYDSLNVGTTTFDGAPYAGERIDSNAWFVNFADGSSYCGGGTGGVLRLDTPCNTGFAPLGTIITTG